MANPPFNMKEWDTGIKDDDPRWHYGRPPSGNANFAWLQHMLYHLAPNGSMALLLANGASGVLIGESNVETFRALLESVCIYLAREVARDGEGATRLVSIRVLGAQSESEAKQCAMTIANSPLDKVALETTTAEDRASRVARIA